MEPPTFMSANGQRQRRVNHFKHALCPPFVLLAVLMGQSYGLSQEDIPPPPTPVTDGRLQDCPIFNDASILDISTDITPLNNGKFPTDCSELLGDGTAHTAVELQPTGTIGRPFHYAHSSSIARCILRTPF